MLSPFKITRAQKLERPKDFHFINVDLELESSQNLKPLVGELSDKDKVFVLYSGEYDDGKRIRLAIGNIRRKRKWISESYNDEKDLVGGTDVLILAFCDLVENLSPKSRKLWDGCPERSLILALQAEIQRKAIVR